MIIIKVINSQRRIRTLGIKVKMVERANEMKNYCTDCSAKTFEQQFGDSSRVIFMSKA